MESVSVKTILSARTACGWFGSNYTMNLYRGCCHGCIYCDSRCECYHVERFDTVRRKERALDILEKELQSKRETGIVITGSMSDCYNPFEEKERLTRGALTLFLRYGFGAVIDTKSPLVTRDADLLSELSARAPAVVNFTVTTADDALCRRIERYVAPTSARFEAMEALSKRGIACGVLLMPILPFINDTWENTSRILSLAQSAGAKYVYAGGRETAFSVTLRLNQRKYYLDRLDERFPGFSQDYIRAFGGSTQCASKNASALWDAFTAECEKRGLLYQMSDIVPLIQRIGGHEQLSLF